MKNMKLGKKAFKPKPNPKTETIFDTEKRLRNEAIEIAKNYVHTKPIKYLLK
jgi:hypothetical protein